MPGHRDYYSLTGAAASWTPIPELSLRPAGTLDVTLALLQPWAPASRLYLLWADANASVTDLACQIDNFYVAALRLGLACSLSAPTNGAVLGVPAHITMSASISGQPTETIEFLRGAGRC